MGSAWDRLGMSLRRHPWRWTAAALAPLVFLPAIDLSVSALFFDPVSRSFPARQNPFAEWVRKVMPIYLFSAAALVMLAWAVGEIRRKAVLGVTRQVGAYLLLSLAVGPGLIVNVILKDSWGRPRPSTIREFGGDNYYVPPLIVSDQCDTNCSFSSGHGALGFWPVAFALLAPPRWRPLALAASLLFGLMVGVVRIAQGGHFLSDVAFSAAIVIGVTGWLHRRLFRPSGGGSSKNNPPKGLDSQ